MKNRTLIGLICIVLSVVLMVFVVPRLSKIGEGTVSLVRAKTDIPRGTRITEAMVETVKVYAQDIGAKSLSDTKDAVGKFAACDMFAGDPLTAAKVKATADDASDVLYRLEEGELAVTVAFPDSARGFSGQLENGDIIKIFLTDAGNTAVSPEELHYVRVITTLTQSGESRDGAKVGTGATSQEKASTVMLAVNAVQAGILLRYSGSTNISCAFVCHGSDARAAGYLAEQAALFVSSAVTVPEDGGEASLPEAD